MRRRGMDDGLRLWRRAIGRMRTREVDMARIRMRRLVDGLGRGGVGASDPGRLIDLEDQQVRNAAIDGLWQALMLAGVMNVCR